MKKHLSFVVCFLLCCSYYAEGQVISTLAGPNVLLSCGGSIARDHSGNSYVSDECNERILKISASGVVTQIAGNGTYGYNGDGIAATAASLYEPMCVAVDAGDNIYIADMGNERIRKINTSGIISTIAGIGGRGSGGFSGDGGQATAAELYQPAGVFVDGSGNVYIADADNGRIRKVNTSGIISTVAGGSPTFTLGDGGPATAAYMNEPGSVVLDAAGNMYIADAFGGNRIRKVNASGIISTIAGTGEAGYSGDGGPATLAKINNPRGVAVDAEGNVYIADVTNLRIRKVNTSGIITTIAGNGINGFSGDGKAAQVAELSGGNITVDNLGNVYECDNGNSRIRYINNHISAPYFIAGSTQTINICHDTGLINAALMADDLDTGGTLTWTVLSAPLHGSVNVAYTNFSTGTTITPTGLTYIHDTTYSGNDTFSVRISDGLYSDTTMIYVVCDPASSSLVSTTIEHLSVFPNPSDGSFTVNMLSNNNEEVRYIIYNILGEQLKEVTTSTNKQEQLQIKVTSGMYFLSAATSHGTWIAKIFVR